MILLVSETPIAGTIERIGNWMNTLLEEEVNTLVFRNYSNNSFKLTHGAFGALPNWEMYLIDALKKARIVILHNVCNKRLLDIICQGSQIKLSVFYQLHSPPMEGPHFTYEILDNYDFESVWSIGQGHSRFVDSNLIVPNIVPDFVPPFKFFKENKIFIPHMRTTGARWSKKVSEGDIETLKTLKVGNQKMLATIKNLFGREQVTPEEVRLVLWSMNFAVDDLNTGQIHQTGVEAIKSNCITFSAADPWAMSEFSQAIDAPPVPFDLINDIGELTDKVRFYSKVNNLNKRQSQLKEYSDLYLQEERLAQRYVSLISSFLK